jgi:hypothetical protein
MRLRQQTRDDGPPVGLQVFQSPKVRFVMCYSRRSEDTLDQASGKRTSLFLHSRYSRQTLFEEHGDV